MISQLRGALAARLAARKDAEAGFTLIELMVVILIIGILAAIAIPIYLNVQSGANDSAAKSDLGQAKTALVNYISQTGNTTTTLSNLTNYGWTGASNNDAITIVSNTSTSAFCIKATMTGASYSGPWYVTATSTPSTTACS